MTYILLIASCVSLTIMPSLKSKLKTLLLKKRLLKKASDILESGPRKPGHTFRPKEIQKLRALKAKFIKSPLSHIMTWEEFLDEADIKRQYSRNRFE